MDRRSFLKVGLGGVAGAAAATGIGLIARAKDKPPARRQWKTDSDAIARVARGHFIDAGRSCGEAMVAAGCKAIGVTSELVPDIALGLAGGVGLRGRTCGAVSGAAMVLGLAVAQGESDYKTKSTRTMAAAGKLVGQFEKQFGCSDCRTLTGLDLTTPEGIEAMAGGVKTGKCAKFVAEAARMMATGLREIRKG